MPAAMRDRRNQGSFRGDAERLFSFLASKYLVSNDIRVSIARKTQKCYKTSVDIHGCCTYRSALKHIPRPGSAWVSPLSSVPMHACCAYQARAKTIPRPGSGWVSFPKSLLGLLVVLGATHATRAQTPAASAQFTDTPLGGGEFEYNITLQNIGTPNIGTFWNAWVPGEDFMAVSPTDIVPPK